MSKNTKKKSSKRKRAKRNAYLPVFLVVLLAAGIFAIIVLLRGGLRGVDSDEADIYAGMIEVRTGLSSSTWIKPQDGLTENDFASTDFEVGDDGEAEYRGEGYTVEYGIDISSHQGNIDWNAVRDSGIDFAFIRAGGRYYGAEEKDIYSDDLFAENLRNAQAAGLKVGVYFFSQAINPDEAVEEAEYVLSLIAESGAAPELPVYFDWERIEDGQTGVRTDSVGGETLTASAKSFCRTIEAAGFNAGIYFNLDTGYGLYRLSELSDFEFWFAQPGFFPYFYYSVDMWQYSFKGNVEGIDSPCDLNMRFTKTG